MEEHPMTEQAPNTIVTLKNREAMIHPAGDVVAERVPELRSALREAMANGAREMTIDFANVEMVDSTGLGLLISAHNSISKAGGRLAVIHASKEILELFRSMRIHQHFPVSPDGVDEQ
jgi:serine/threonine-protein kinase RsbW